jgi:membrane-bound serine protease (ClpP class)
MSRLRPSARRLRRSAAAVGLAALGTLAVGQAMALSAAALSEAGAAVAARPGIPASPPHRTGPVLVVRLHTIIHPIAAELVRDAVARADREGAAALVLELDTPGGLMASTHEITSTMVAARTPVVVYVAPGGARAASAGFFLLMAADVAAMAPGTHTGAAHPVGPQGESIQGDLAKKIEQDSAADIRALAARNGRDAALAEKAVLESRSFTADEALRARLIDYVAPSRAELLRAIHGRPVHKGSPGNVLVTLGVPVTEMEASSWRALLAAIADPNIAYLLLTLGGLGLFFELMHPGAVLPGVLGAIFLILAFFGLSVLPVNYAGVALIFLALVLFIAELKVMSHGLLTLAGVTCLVLGSLMLFKSADPALRVSLRWVAALGLLAVGLLAFLLAMAARAFRLPVRTGSEGLLRARGVARSALAPAGKVFVHGELWEAVAAGPPVAAGEAVEVVGVRDMTLEVRPLAAVSSWPAGRDEMAAGRGEAG